MDLFIKRGDKVYITFSYNRFMSRDYFFLTLKERLIAGKDYYVLIKIRHNVDLYKMAGKNFILL